MGEGVDQGGMDIGAGVGCRASVKASHSLNRQLSGCGRSSCRTRIAIDCQEPYKKLFGGIWFFFSFAQARTDPCVYVPGP